MGSGAATARMGTSGFRLLLHLQVLLLGKHTLGLKQCNNCVHINDCRQWCSKIEQGGASKLSLEERAEFNDNICGYLFNVDPPTKMCCDTPAEKNVGRSNLRGRVSAEAAKMRPQVLGLG